MKMVLLAESLFGANNTGEFNNIPGNSRSVNANQTSTNKGLQSLVGAAGTLQNLVINLSAAPGVGKSRTFTVRKNNSDTGVTVTISDAATSGSDLVNTVAVSAGDYISIHKTASGTPAQAEGFASLEWDGTTSQQCWGTGGVGASNASNSVQNFAPLISGIGASGYATSIDVPHSSMCPIAGTITALYVQMTTAPSAGKSREFSIYKNGSQEATSSFSISGTNTTGNITGLSIAISPGDTLAFETTPTGTPSGDNGIGWAVTITPTTDGQWPMCSNYSAGSNAATRYFRGWGGAASPASTESDAQYQPGPIMAVKNLYIGMASAPGSGKSYTYRSRVNAGNGNLTVTISDAATTGSDSSNTDQYAANDLIDISAAPSGTPATSAVQIGIVGIYGTVSTPITGTSDLTMPFLDVASAGQMEPAGTSDLTMPFLDVAASGEPSIPGTVAITMPFLDVESAGTPGMTGTATLTMPFLDVQIRAVIKRESATSGPGAIQLYDANGTLQAMVPVVSWETTRKINTVGEWKASLPVTTLISGEPLSTVVTGGWKADLLQQSVWAYDLPNLPYLMYHGVVEDIGFEIDESGMGLCNLSGSFRGIALAGLVTPTTASYSQETFEDVLNDIEDDEMGGIISFPPNKDRTISIGFNTVQADVNGSTANNGILPRMVRMNRVAELARWAWRETWDYDQPEFIAIDAVPRTQYWFINQEAAGPRGFDAGKSNLGLIAGTPSFRREGRGIINRIIAFGGDAYETVDLEAEAGAQLAGDRYGLPPDTAVVPTIVMDTQPVPVRTLTIEGVTYSFVTGATDASGHVGVGSNLSDAQQALKDAISGDDGFNTAHPRIYLGDWAGDTAIIYFRLSPRPDNEIDWSGTFASDGGNTIDIGTPDTNTITKTTTRPLTLEFATKSIPYVPQQGVNPDGTDYWYLEDGTSVGLFGPRETVIQRGDIRSAAATDEAREAAANVLYLVTYSQLLKQSSPIRYADVAIANGAGVWALPADAVTVRYVGNVTLDGEVTTWMELSDLWIVIERNDRMTDAGVREVSFKIAQPEITIEIPELQEALGLTQNGTDDDGNILLNGSSDSDQGSSGSTGVGAPGTLPDYDPGVGPVFTGAGIPNGPGLGPVFPGGGGSLFPGCCAPPDEITGVSDPPAPPDGGGEEPSAPSAFLRFSDDTEPPDAIPEAWNSLALNPAGQSYGEETGILTILQFSEAGVPGTPSAAGGWTSQFDSDLGSSYFRATILTQEFPDPETSEIDVDLDITRASQMGGAGAYYTIGPVGDFVITNVQLVHGMSASIPVTEWCVAFLVHYCASDHESIHPPTPPAGMRRLISTTFDISYVKAFSGIDQQITICGAIATSQGVSDQTFTWPEIGATDDAWVLVIEFGAPP